MDMKHFSSKRYGRMFLLLFLSILAPVICGIIHNTRIDHIILWIFLSVLFFACFFLYTENQRFHEKLALGIADDYKMIATVFILGIILSSVGSFLPDFCAPVLLISVICNGVFSSKLGLIMGIYFSVLTGLYSNGQDIMVACYVTLAIIGSMFAELIKQKKLSMWHNVIICCYSVIIPVCFQYFSIHRVEIQNLFICLGLAVLTILIARFGMHVLVNYEEEAHYLHYETIMDDSYHLKKEIQKYSTIDYNHAMRTSRIAAIVAKEVGADEALCAAGGFYYRLGKIEGEPFIDNGVALAEQNCFPKELVTILSEYCGEKRLPSTIESAIVHITDCLVTKFDLLDKDTFSTTWNRDIVVYQTMNEKSAEGLYDESGLTMNQFLKIRERMVKEDLFV